MTTVKDILFGSLLGSGSGGGGKNSTVKLTSDVPVAIIGSDSQPRVKCSFSAEVTGDYTIQEYGILYSNNGSHASADFTIDDVDGTNVKKGNLYSGNILDNGTGVVARGYVKVNDQYIYTGDIGGKYADLKEPLLVTKNITENGIYSASADNADGYSQVTVDVSPPAPIPPTRSGATIYDFDGSVIATYTPEEFAALTEYPEHPEHEYLTGNGYNWSLADAQAYSAKYGYVEVGAQYRVTDGKTRLFIRLEEGRLEPQLGLGINGSVEVDWGDGSAHDTMTGSDVSTTVYQAHTYAQAGDYVIALTVIDGDMQFNGESGFGHILSKSGGDTSTNRAYLNALLSLYIGDGVTSIGLDAFESCFSLTSVTIPNDVRAIGRGAFYNCVDLASVTIPNGIASIDFSTVGFCSDCSSAIISDSVTSIDMLAFAGCNNLSMVTIPDSVTGIEMQAFFNCYRLVSVTIPDSVTSIGSDAFNGCCGLSSVKFTSETPPTVANVNAWNNLPADCIIYVPHGTLSAYTSATNYPDPATYTYVEY